MPETDPWVDFKIDSDSKEEEGEEGPRRNDESDDETVKKSNSEESEHEEPHEENNDATSSAVDKDKVEKKAKKISSNTKARWSGKSSSQRLGPPLFAILLAGQHLILNLN